MRHRIEVTVGPSDGPKAKGELLERLADDLLRRQSYEVEAQVRVTATELDLLCNHKVSGRILYVECKAHQDPLSATELKKLLGTINLKDYHEGWLVSAGPLGKDAKGFKVEWEGREQSVRQTLSIYDPPRIVTALQDANVICRPPEEDCRRRIADEAAPGDWTLLICPHGRFWICTCLTAGIPTNVIVFSADDGRLVTDLALLRRLKEQESTLRSLDFESRADLEIELQRTDSNASVVPNVVEVKHGESWDDYRPARPEHFIGRDEAQRRVIDFLKSVRGNNTSTRVFAITGDTGMGKSSLVAKLRSRVSNKRWRRQFYIYAADVRAAQGPSYIPATLLECLRSAAKRGFGIESVGELLVSDHADPLASESIADFLAGLAKKEEVVCLIIDQFEELYSKPDLFAVFEEAQRLFLSVTAAVSNLVVGFVLRSDSTVQQDHPAYYLWHRLADHRFETRLRVFSPRETSAALTVFERELGEPLRPELRRQISENCEGYPWLLKKLCLHLFEQIRAGVDQSQLDETMDVESLFASDLNACSSPERSCLQVIARQSPADWYDILDAAGVEVVRSLQDKRLIVRSGDRLNLYWDVFREYVLTGKVPSLPFTYLPSSPSIGSFLSVAARLSHDTPTSREEVSTQSGLSAKTVGNVIHDLMMFGIAKGTPSAVWLDRRMTSSSEQDILKRIRVVFKRHALYRQLTSLDPGSVIRVEDMVKALRDANPAAKHRQSTWEIYAERLGPWLVSAGLLQVTPKGWVLRDTGHPTVPSRRGSRVRLGCFSGSAPPARVSEALLWLMENEPVTKEEIRKSGLRNAFMVLDRLELTSRDESGNCASVRAVADISNAEAIVWHAAEEEESLQAVWEFLNENPSASGTSVGAFLSEWDGQQWSDSTKMRIGNAVRNWALWIGQGANSAGIVPHAPGPRVRKQRVNKESCLFDLDKWDSESKE